MYRTIAFVTVNTGYTEAQSALFELSYGEPVDQTPKYSSWARTSAGVCTTVFLIDDWAYGDNDTIILYLDDGRTLQTATSNVVLMYEPTVEGYVGGTNVSNDDQNVEQSGVGNETIVEDGNTTEVNNEPSPFTYHIDDYTVDELLAECQYYFNNVPQEGSTYEDYYSTIKAEPVSTYETSCYFSNNIDKADGDVIKSINLAGPTTQMDGTIGYSNENYSVQIDLIIQDYDRASELYDKLLNYISTTYYTDVNDNRDSTNWRAYSSSLYTTPVIQMSKAEDGYYISVFVNSKR